MKDKDKDTVPRQMQPAFDTVVQLTDQVCTEHLNEEYSHLSRTLAAALCRKRPSPLTRGRVETWACHCLHSGQRELPLRQDPNTPPKRGRIVRFVRREQKHGRRQGQSNHGQLEDQSHGSPLVFAKQAG